MISKTRVGAGANMAQKERNYSKNGVSKTRSRGLSIFFLKNAVLGLGLGLVSTLNLNLKHPPLKKGQTPTSAPTPRFTETLILHVERFSSGCVGV